MEVKDIRKLSISDIIDKIKEVEKNVVDLNIQKAAGEVKNVAQIVGVRRSVARLKTILSEKKGACDVSTK
jgi:large subunit ribosomal protein L29